MVVAVVGGFANFVYRTISFWRGKKTKQKQKKKKSTKIKLIYSSNLRANNVSSCLCTYSSIKSKHNFIYVYGRYLFGIVNVTNADAISIALFWTPSSHWVDVCRSRGHSFNTNKNDSKVDMNISISPLAK